jgi:glucose-1-phosphate adenylyltransferase
MIMAGGQGERLYPLTKTKAKPAVTFGGSYRIIDFTLSNCINSGIRRMYLLTQYSNATLDRHIQCGWNIFSHEMGEFIRTLPPQKMHMDSWYRGTADSIYQNLALIDHVRPDDVLILSGDHIYKMDYRKLINYHRRKGGNATLSCVTLPLEECRQMGVMRVDKDFKVIGFQEKPKRPKAMPDDPNRALANMGVYVFRTEALVRSLVYDARRNNEHDFGKNIIPRMIKKQNVYAYNFQSEGKGVKNYWRDVGTVDAYCNAHRELLSNHPPLDPYELDWPIRTFQEQAPPARIMYSEVGTNEGPSGGPSISNSLISNGCILDEGAQVKESVLSPFVVVKRGGHVESSILMKGVTVGENAQIRNAVIDEGITIPAHYLIGYNKEKDRKRFAISDSGTVVVPEGCILD